MADPDYFTLAEFKALPDMSAASDDRINAAAAYFTDIVERELGYSLVPRTVTDQLTGDGTDVLVLPHAYAISITSITVDGVAVAPSLTYLRAGCLRFYDFTPWTRTRPGNITVVYEVGRFATCPADVKDAVMWACRDRLLSQDGNAGIDARRTSITTEFGTTSYVLPGENRPTGYPELDAVILSYKANTTSFGFA